MDQTTPKVVISARVDARTKELAEMAARLRAITLSHFVEDAVNRVALEQLMPEPTGVAANRGTDK